MKSVRTACFRQLNPVLVKSTRALSRVRLFEMALDLFMTKLFPNIGIPFLESARSTSSMEGDWDTRANVGALIAATGEADEKKAEASAVKALETRILKGVDLDRCVAVLEIGCGIGNLLKPLSALVKEAHGVDISGEMLRLAGERLRDCPNVFLHKTDGYLGMLQDNYFGLVFSSGVFIHFPSKLLVYEYFKEVARVLKPGGIFRFHVDGRYYLRWRRQKGGTLRGVVFNPEEIRENLERYDLAVRDITGAGSSAMWTTAILAKS
jgi:SAM-dependent methyltransferase